MTEAQKKNEETILPEEPAKALSKLIEISDKLAELMEDETNAVAMNDAMKFMATEEEKFRLSQRYDRAAAEFQKRQAEFKGISADLLDRLEKSQKRLKEAAQDNVKILEKYKKPVKKDKADKTDENKTDKKETEK